MVHIAAVATLFFVGINNSFIFAVTNNSKEQKTWQKKDHYNKRIKVARPSPVMVVEQSTNKEKVTLAVGQGFFISNNTVYLRQIIGAA